MLSQIRRRDLLFVCGAFVALPIVRAEEKIRRIGGLFGGSPMTHSRALDAFRMGLVEHGWVEGRNVTLELRWAEGRMDRLPALAAELVRSNPDVILTAANPVIAEVRKTTRSLPIVMATGSDPVEWGFVASLARPGGNLTGLTGFYESTPVKMLALAGALVPRGACVAIAWKPTRPSRGSDIASNSRRLRRHWTSVRKHRPTSSMGITELKVGGLGISHIVDGFANSEHRHVRAERASGLERSSPNGHANNEECVDVLTWHATPLIRDSDA